MPVPTGVKVEVEFTSGVWTDVTADFDYNVGYTIAVGRTTPSGQAQVSTCQVQLRNPLGAYTPGVQVLSDGTAAPYYPNVQIRKRLRVSDSAGVQFVGGIKAWVPQTNGFGGSSFCVVSASDLMDRLSRVTMLSPIAQVEQTLASTLYYPLTDAAGSSQAGEFSGNLGPALRIGQTGSGGPVTFGADGPLTGDGTSIAFAPVSASAGQFLTADVGNYIDPGLQNAPPRGVPTRLAFALNVTSAPVTARVLLSFSTQDLGSGINWTEVGVDTSGHITIQDDGNMGGAGPIVGPAVCDGNWHGVLIGYTLSGVFPTQIMNYQLWVDGSLAATGTTPKPSSTPGIGSTVRVGQSATVNASALVTGRISQLMLWGSAPSMATAGPAFGGAVSAFTGELVSDRVKRFLGYAGLIAANWNIDASAVVCGSYPQGGKDVVSACQDMAVTEGGGSVFYVQAGVAQFRNRTFRKPAAPVITVDMALDADRAYQPSLDDQNLANSSTASRATASGTASQQTVTDPVRSDPNTGEGLVSQDVTTYTTSDADALALAQSIVAAGRAGWRLPRITIDLLTATHNLYASVQALVIGSRMRATVLPAGQAPGSQLDVIVEGWTRTVNVNTNSVAIDSSPADNPRRGVWGDGTTITDVTYGRWQANSDCALNAAITNSATTVVIANPTGPTFTTNAAMYPLDIRVGAETITLNTVPGGAASPQTFTGVTRGAKGTTASAQVINAPVTLWPITTWTL